MWRRRRARPAYRGRECHTFVNCVRMFVFARLVRAPDVARAIARRLWSAKVRCRRIPCRPFCRCGDSEPRRAELAQVAEILRTRSSSPSVRPASAFHPDSRNLRSRWSPPVLPNRRVSRLAGAVAVTDYAASARATGCRTTGVLPARCRAAPASARSSRCTASARRRAPSCSVARRTCGAAASRSCLPAGRRLPLVGGAAVLAWARCSTSRGCRSGWRSSARR